MTLPPDIAIAISYLKHRIPDLSLWWDGCYVGVIGTSLQILSHWTKIPESRIERQSDGYRIGISDLHEMQSRGHYGDRSDLPTLRIVDGNRHWYREGKPHREDGPAVEYASGDHYWYRDGQLHREDGPAVEYASGDCLWYRDGQLHREDGPAIEYASGDCLWYRNGECCDPPSKYPNGDA